MLDGNLSTITNFTKVSPYNKVDTANAMPINQHRTVNAVQNSLRSKEYIQKQNIREIYSSNLSPSSSISTEKYIKSRANFSPIFMHNEARTKYELISRIPMNKKDLNSEVTILA